MCDECEMPFLWLDLIFHKMSTTFVLNWNKRTATTFYNEIAAL